MVDFELMIKSPVGGINPFSRTSEQAVTPIHPRFCHQEIHRKPPCGLTGNEQRGGGSGGISIVTFYVGDDNEGGVGLC
ncbi:hypothetical protein D3C75_949340 [compost metagenome]